LDCDRLRNRLKESTNNPRTTPNTIASIGNPGIPGPGGAAEEVDSAVVVDVVGIVDVDVEIELVVCCCVSVVVVCTWVVDHVVDVVVIAA
jgi:hypothetical protein